MTQEAGKRKKARQMRRISGIFMTLPHASRTNPENPVFHHWPMVGAEAQIDVTDGDRRVIATVPRSARRRRARRGLPHRSGPRDPQERAAVLRRWFDLMMETRLTCRDPDGGEASRSRKRRANAYAASFRRILRDRQRAFTAPSCPRRRTIGHRRSETADRCLRRHRRTTGCDDYAEGRPALPPAVRW